MRKTTNKFINTNVSKKTGTVWKEIHCPNQIYLQNN